METQTKLLVISKDFSLYDAVKRASLPGETDIVFCHPDEDFLSLIRESSIKIALIDLLGDSADAESLLKKVKRYDAMIDAVMLGEPIEHEAILDWIYKGATDYLAKPFSKDSVRTVLQRISERTELRRETLDLEKELEKKYVFQGMISRNPHMLEVFALIEKISKHFTSVLITGETGTGKEMVARAIHHLSPLKSRNFIVCDCTSIPENLFESELFGYKKGAFTGADKDKKGLFEEADKSVIFLDEIAEIPVSIQSKLLRVLENHQFRPLGSNESRTVDVRIIAATNRDLEKSIKTNTFREDLFHRLNKIEIHLPPLVDRLEDIPLLVRHFLQARSRAYGKSLKGVSRDVQKIFLKYKWPGNIRELENVLESAALLCKKEFIDISDLPKQIREINASETRPSFVRRESLSSLEDLEKDYIAYLLKYTRNNLRRTAKILGISRTTLYNKMEKYNLSR